MYLEQHMVITGGRGRLGYASRPSVSAASYVLGGLGTCIGVVVLVVLVQQALEDAVAVAGRRLLPRAAARQQIAQLGRVLGAASATPGGGRLEGHLPRVLHHGAVGRRRLRVVVPRVAARRRTAALPPPGGGNRPRRDRARLLGAGLGRGRAAPRAAPGAGGGGGGRLRRLQVPVARGRRQELKVQGAELRGETAERLLAHLAGG